MKTFLVALSLALATPAMVFAKDNVEGVTISLSSKGNDIAFDKTAIQIPFAPSISINFKNEATKASEILHNVAILKPGSADGFLKDLQLAGYDVKKMRAHPAVIVMTADLPPGESEAVTFKPAEPGIYPYVCIMPGHADMLGMKGFLNIASPPKK